MLTTLWQTLTGYSRLLRRQREHPACPQPLLDNSDCESRLRLWQQERRTLTVSQVGGHATAHTHIIAIDSERELLWLDEPFGGLAPLKEGQTLRLSVRHGYKMYSFASAVVATVTGSWGQSVALLTPRELHLAPRRQARRHTLRGAPLPVNVRAPGNHTESAQLINISCDGLRITLNGQHLARYKPGTLLPFCQFSLGPNLSIRCQALVKAARLDKRHGRQTQVSLHFADIPPTQRQQLAAYLSRLDQLNYVSDAKAATAA